jgi:hypothetical protein
LKISTMHDDSSKMWFLRSSKGRRKIGSFYSSSNSKHTYVLRIGKLTVGYYGFMPLKRKLQIECS